MLNELKDHIADFKLGLITAREMSEFVDEYDTMAFDAMRELIDAQEEYSDRQERIITAYVRELAYVVSLLNDSQMQSYVWYVQNNHEL